MSLLGTVLDNRYKIESVLGQGGMGMVFRATQTSVQRPVAVKTLNPALAAAPTFFERFRREAEVASRLRHPNIITIYDFGRAQDNTCYFVMELLEGESLKEIVKREGPMSLRRAVSLMEQAARGLAHAHAENAVHRDLKPHNIMVQQLDGKDFVKVLDFGLVKAMEQEEEEQLTSTGQVLGTPQYMPPEQAGGEVVDQRSDLYSLTGVLYFCLTGTSPYGANTVRKALTAALTQSVPPVNTKRQGAPVPPELDAFMQKGLAREKEDRFQSAEEFIECDAGRGGGPERRAAGHAALGRGHRARGGAAAAGPAASPELARAAPAARVPRRSPATQRAGAPRLPTSSSPRAPPAARPPPPLPAQRLGGARTPASAPAPPPPEPSPTACPPARRRRWSAFPLLLLLAGGAVVVLRPSAPAPLPPQQPQVVEVPREQPSKPPAETVKTRSLRPRPAATVVVKLLLHARSGPAIFNEEGVQIGTTPTSLVLPRDKKHTLTFQLPGYQDTERPLDFSVRMRMTP